MGGWVAVGAGDARGRGGVQGCRLQLYSGARRKVIISLVYLFKEPALGLIDRFGFTASLWLISADMYYSHPSSHFEL